MELQFQWLKSEKQIMEEKTGGEKGLLFLANEAKGLMDKYVPADELILADDVRIYVEDDVGVVEYTSPYAHYQYKGELYVSSITGSSWAAKGEFKVPTGKKLEQGKSVHPNATSEWDKAMMVGEKGKLAKAFQKYVGGG